MKDFAAEIRAHLDVEHFLSQAQLMLDVQETNMEDIMDCMLHHLLDNEEAPAAFVEAKKVLFTHDSGWFLSLWRTKTTDFVFFVMGEMLISKYN